MDINPNDPSSVCNDENLDVVSDENNYDQEENDFFETDQKILRNGDANSIVQLLIKKKKICAANYFKEDCLRNIEKLFKGSPPNLIITEICDVLLNPGVSISNCDTISWLQHLIASGSDPKKFYQEVESYDNPTTCSLVWTADFMAYRCRTCGISPCMSLCLGCFHSGDHDGHDFNMFKSQSGGACDCGNKAVMLPSGFCSKHNGSKVTIVVEQRENMLLMARVMMPWLFRRFILYCRLRGNTKFDTVADAMEEAGPFIEFLQEMCRCGKPMRTIMTEIFYDPQIYKTYMDFNETDRYYDEKTKGETIYIEALESIDVGDALEGFEDITELHGSLVHNTFIEEFMFWTMKYEFPQRLVCFLLNMRPDPIFEDAFARTFVQHYSRMAIVLVKSKNLSTLSHRVVHVSVQLFSDNSLTLRMTESYHLLHVMILSLKNMIKKICVQCTIHNEAYNSNMVADCTGRLMREHCYWPLVSDLNNILSFKNIADILLGDKRLLHEWISFLMLLQGMNNNIRQMVQFVDFDTLTYYASFSAELEASASPVWALISHLKDESTRQYSMSFLQECLLVLNQWFQKIGFGYDEQVHYEEISFHYPLHRNYALVLRQAVKKQKLKLKDGLPSRSMLSMMLVHLMSTQAFFFAIMAEEWSRNGIQMKGQAMTYVQCQFCNSMIDPDLFLLQVGAGEMPKDSFLISIFERFNGLNELIFTRDDANNANNLPEQTMGRSLESLLYFLALLTTNRNSIGLSEEQIAEREMMSLLCCGDKTHSRVIDQIPEKCLGCTSINFEKILGQMTSYHQPICATSGKMKQGMYVPKPHVWEDMYDPIFVQLRTLYKRDIDSSQTRFKQFVKDTNKFDQKNCCRLWPPYRLPSPVMSCFVDPRRILACRTFHAIVFVLLYKCLNTPSPNETHLGLIIYLLELTIEYQSANVNKEDDIDPQLPTLHGNHTQIDRQNNIYYKWYSTDDVFINATSLIDRIKLKNSINMRSVSESTVAADDFEMVEIEGYERLLPIGGTNNQSVRSLMAGSELVPYSSSSAIVPSDQRLDYSDNLHRDVQLLSTGQCQSILAGSEVAIRHTRDVVQQPNRFYSTRPRRLTGATTALSSDISVEDVDSTVVHYLSDGSSSSNKALVELSVDGAYQSLNVSKYSSTSPNDPVDQFIDVDETLISLLLKLHSKLSGVRGAYMPNFQSNERDSRIGDGPFFISKILDKMGRINSLSRTCIINTRRELYPEVYESSHISSDEDLLAGDRKLKADESKKRAMAFFKKKRGLFMKREKLKKLAKESFDDSSDADDAEMVVNDVDDTPSLSESNPQSVPVATEGEKCHECAICFTTKGDFPSQTSKLIGYIGLLTPTSVVGHRLQSQIGHGIPLCDFDYRDLRQRRRTLGKYMENKRRQLELHFDPPYSFTVLNQGWRENVHVQICGHTVHVACLQKYMSSLNSSHKSGRDFMCPLCRKSSNALIPIIPFSKESMDVPVSDYVTEIDRELATLVAPDADDFYNVQADALMSLLSVPTPFNYDECLSSPQVFQFFGTVLRNTVEDLLILFGGTLINYNRIAPRYRRSPIASLKCCLSHQAKSLMIRRDIDVGGTYWTRDLWSSLTQCPINDFKRALVAKDRQVPMLFRDPITLLLHLLILTRIEYNAAHFNCIVRYVHRLVVVQATASLLIHLTEKQRSLVTTQGPLAPLFAMVFNHLHDCLHHLKNYSSKLKQVPSYGNWSQNEVTCELREQCLSFLRIASLLKNQLSDEPLPTIVDPLAEPGALEQYLDVWDTCSVVNTAAMSRMCGSLMPVELIPISKSSSSTYVGPIRVPVETHLGDLFDLSKMWCAQLCGFALQAPASTVLLMFNERFFKPRLLALPDTYEEVFSFYHMKLCSQCGNLPEELAVCLVCGECVCLTKPCLTKENSTFGCSMHAKWCGNGTAIFLSISQTTINICRGHRLSIWGCLHLDSYGEEDRDLKRGKPLFLSKQRYDLLQQQWIMHMFDHIQNKWFYPPSSGTSHHGDLT